MEDKINITLVINENITYEKLRLIYFRGKIFLKDYRFLSLVKNMGKNLSKNLSGKYSQRLLDHVKQFAKDPLNKSNSKKRKSNW